MNKLTQIFFKMIYMVSDYKFEPFWGSTSPSHDSGTSSKVKKGSWEISCFWDIISQAYISEVDEGINPNPLLKVRYGQVQHIGSILGSWSPLQGSGMSTKVKKVPEKYPVFLHYQSCLYLRGRWRNQSQSFTKSQVWSGTKHWIHFGLLISITGIRNVHQSQNGSWEISCFWTLSVVLIPQR